MCEALSVPCQVHIPNGKETEMMYQLKNTKATIIYEKVGYNNVLNAHAKQSALELNYKFIPLGMIGCTEAINIIKHNVAKLLNQFSNTQRIVVPVGSGTTMIGICEYLYDLLSLYNKFYNNYNILNESDLNVKETYLAISKLVYNVSHNLLNILAIDEVERM